MSEKYQKREEKLGYDQIHASKDTSDTSSTRNGNQSQKSRTDIARTNETTTSGEKKSSSTSETKSDKKSNQTQTRNGQNTERANIGFQITFTVPLTGIMPTSSTNNNGSGC